MTTPMTIAFADLESDGLLPTITKLHQISIILRGGATFINMNGEYPCNVPLSFNDHTSRDGTLSDALFLLSCVDRTVWHNGLAYDLWAISKTTDVVLDWKRVVDTLVLSRLGNPQRKGFRPHSLESWGTRLGVEKVAHAEWDEWTPAMERRCDVDVIITEKLYDRLAPMLERQPDAVALEHAVAWETTKMHLRGVRLDVPKAEGLARELHAEEEKLRDEVCEVMPPILVPPKPSETERVLKVVNRRHPLHGALDAGSPYCPLVVQEFNPGSHQQIASRFITKYGWRPLEHTKTGLPKVTDEIVQDLPYPEAKVVGKYLKVSKLANFIDGEPKSQWEGGGWLHHVRHGRVHASFNPLRAVTGRPSCSSPNLQQVPKDVRLRSCFVPSTGRVLVGWDADSIEMRMLGHYLHRYDGGKFAREVVEGDVHSEVMRLIGFDLRRDDPELLKLVNRDQTKRCEYCIIYGGGNPKIASIAYKNAQLSDRSPNYGAVRCRPMANGSTPTARKYGGAIRRAIMDGVTGWSALDGAVKSKAIRDKRLRGVDGRTLWVRSPHSALNLLLQSAAIIVVKKVLALATPSLEAAGLVEDEDFALVLWVHDELQFECKPEAVGTVKTVLNGLAAEAGKSLGIRCDLSGTAAEGANWSETH